MTRSFMLGNLEIHEDGKLYRIKNSGKKIETEPVKHIIFNKPRMVGTYCENGKQKQVYLAREIAKRFLENAENKPYVSFKDGDSLNISVENLIWINGKERAEIANSTKENNGTISKKRKRDIEGKEHKRLEEIKEKYKNVDKEKLPEEWLSILEERLNGETLKEIGDKRNLFGSSINHILGKIENTQYKTKKKESDK